MSEARNCPKCGGEMEKGYIITPAIRWSKEKHMHVSLGQELIVSWGLKLANIGAYRCTKCRLVLFHYPLLKAEITPDSFLKKCGRCGEIIPIASDYCPKCGTKQTKGVES
jgi:ssDNA-binding Zn-finger/Zn-ribbon topoisomerase 1